MKPFSIALVLCILLSSLPLEAQLKTGLFMHGPGSLANSTAASSSTLDPTVFHSLKKPGHYSVKDWRALVDSTWGPGLPTSTKLQIFDSFWNGVNTYFAGFPYLDVNWDSLKALYRPEVAAGVSRGRFQAILGHMYLPLCEVHTWIADAGLDSSFIQGGNLVYRPGVPMFWTNGWGPVGNFGAALSPLPDSTLLVYRAVASHPLGLVPGDIVLGYDGIPWKRLYKDLLSAQLPLEWWYNPSGSTDRSTTYAMLNSAGNNWGLFDTIDVVKYSSGDTVHLPTAPLAGLDWFSLYSTDQLPVPGVPMPDLKGGKCISYGVVENTQIGYVYACRWNAEDSAPFAAAMADLLTVKKVAGLILDFRYNLGSANSTTASNAGYDYLFGQNPGGASRWRNAMRTGGHNDFSYSSPYDAGVIMQPNSYDGPVAVLVGPHAKSAGDLNAFLMRSYFAVRFFGLPTNGSFPVPGSVDGVEGQWGTWYYYYAGGQMQSLINNEGLLMHKGFPVDEEVWLTRDGVARGEDDVVKRVLEWITTARGLWVTLVAPADNEDLESNSFSLSWNHTAVPAVRYHLQLATDSLFTQIVIDDSTLTDTSYAAEGIAKGKYYWRVCARDVNGWGIYSSVRCLTVTVGVVRDDFGVPRQYALEQNYPNPFNPSTTIKYDLPTSAMVRLSVYDVLGREVSVLVNERKNAGLYEVKFDATGLSSGVYFYQLRAGEFVQTKRLFLAR